ncbi:MAG TPA: DUF4349 domain-containing protein, partial [Gaiellaceae bacterium]|nr:DUF4349 domain-containing protein [Gaiellaceae bacterium]
MAASEMTIETLRARAPRAPEALRLRVLELEPRRMSPRRRLALVVVPVAAALAVGAALVHGFLGSSSPKPVAQQTLRAAAEPAHGKAFAPIPSVAGAPTRLQHTEASLEIRVKDASASATKATRIATSLGGFAESVQYSSTSRSAFVVLRVPAQEVKTAVARLAGLGTLVSQDLSVQDLQHDFDVETAQIAQLRRTVVALKTALRNPSLPDAQCVLLQIRLANAKRSLAQRLNARKGTVTAGTTARISVQLHTKSQVVPVPRPQGRLGR